MFKKIIFALSSIITFKSYSQVILSKCDPILTHSENIQVSRYWVPEEQLCQVSIHPMNVTDLIYRDYLMNSQGLLLVFNSYGVGPDSTTTGAREFYFFPRKDPYLKIEFLNNKDVAVTMSNQQTLIFDAQTAQLKQISGSSIKVDAKVSKLNRGGVEIQANSNLFLDFGFKMGSQASSNLKGQAVFKNFRKELCNIKNKELIKYHNSEPVFYLTDSEIMKKLVELCPQFDSTL